MLKNASIKWLYVSYYNSLGAATNYFTIAQSADYFHDLSISPKVKKAQIDVFRPAAENLKSSLILVTFLIISSWDTFLFLKGILSDGSSQEATRNEADRDATKVPRWTWTRDVGVAEAESVVEVGAQAWKCK